MTEIFSYVESFAKQKKTKKLSFHDSKKSYKTILLKNYGFIVLKFI